MHELSLVRSLLLQVETLVREHGGGRVGEIRLEIGPLSGVEPLLVQSAFAQLVESSAAAGAQLVIDEVPLGAVCSSCDRPFEVERFRFECPACASRQVRITRGDEFRLVSIVIREPQPVEENVP